MTLTDWSGPECVRRVLLLTGAKRMRLSLCRLRMLLILIAGLAVLCAGAVKWRRYVVLSERIATYASLEKRLMDEARMPDCLGRSRACRAVAEEQRRLIEDCEREIRRIW